MNIMVIKLGEYTVEKAPIFQGFQLVGHLEFRCWLHCNVPHQSQLIFFQVPIFFDEEGFLTIKATGNRSHHASRTPPMTIVSKCFIALLYHKKQEMKSPLVKNAINQFHIPSANRHLLHRN